MNKPYIKLYHVIIEAIAMLLVIAALVLSIIQMSTIDGPIPTHFDIHGNVDGYGSATTLLIMPIIMLITNIIMSLTMHLMPASSWNMPFKINQARSLKVLSDCCLMIALMELEIGVFTLAYAFAVQNPGLLFKEVIIFIAAMILTTILIILKAKHDNG